MSKQNEKVLPVFASQAELDQAVAEARKSGAKPRLLKRYEVNGAFVYAPNPGKALHAAFMAEVPGIKLRELGSTPPIDLVLNALSGLSEEERAAVRQALGNGAKPTRSRKSTTSDDDGSPTQQTLKLTPES